MKNPRMKMRVLVENGTLSVLLTASRPVGKVKRAQRITGPRAQVLAELRDLVVTPEVPGTN